MPDKKFDIFSAPYPVMLALGKSKNSPETTVEYAERILREEGLDLKELRHVLSHPGESYREWVDQACLKYPALLTLRKLSQGSWEDEDTRLPRSHFIWHVLARSPVLKFSCDVIGQLESTNISKNLPARFLRPPFTFCYIDFSEDHWKLGAPSAPYTIYSCGVDYHFSGAYLSWDTPDETFLLGGQPQFFSVLRMTLVFWESLYSHERVLTYDLIIPILDNSDEQTLGEVLLEIEAQAKAATQRLAATNWLKRESRYGVTDYPYDVERNSQVVINGAARILKCLVTLATHEAKLSVSNLLDKAVADVDNIKNPAKRQKALRQAYRQSNQIIIRGKDFGLDDDHDSEGNSLISKSVHWRRGHFRNAAVGPGRQEAKVVWVRPTLVNREKLAPGDEAPAVKEYLVTQ